MKLHNTSIHNLKVQGGFTLIEVILAVAIITALGGVGLWMSMDAYRGYSYRSEKNNFISALERARIASMTNINEARHGIHIDTISNTYTIFQGNDYAGRNDSFDQVFTAPGLVVFSGMTDIIFDQLSGAATVGTTTIVDNNRTTVITFNNEGAISW